MLNAIFSQSIEHVLGKETKKVIALRACFLFLMCEKTVASLIRLQLII